MTMLIAKNTGAARAVLIEGRPTVDGAALASYVPAVSAQGAAFSSFEKVSKDVGGNAFDQPKSIDYTPDAQLVLSTCGITTKNIDEDLLALGEAGAAPFVATYGQLRLWDQELKSNLDALGLVESP